jgi:DNA-binding NtrC family response regulator
MPHVASDVSNSIEADDGYRGRILLVDDDPAQVLLASEILAPDGHQVRTALSGEEALELLRAGPADLVVADLMMPGMNGFDLLREISDSWPELPVIFLTGHDDVASAVSAIKEGAENYVTKPFDVDRFRLIIARALERKALRDDNARLREMVRNRRGSFGAILGGSAAMQALYDQLEVLAPTNSTVLLLGESGTGKDLTAREIHRRSKRSEGPFLAVNCGALPSTLLESELFGHEKGAFTGATATKVGLFEAANGGTIFLDEIGTTTPSTQKSLLRVLQEREVRRVGGTQSHPIDVRVLSATNANLQVEMEAGSFRSDLYFRLSGVVLSLPPLREREADIGRLAEHFLAQTCQRHGKNLLSFSPRSLERLQRYNWPGNIRELENVVERAVIFAQRVTIGPSDLQIPGAPEDGANDDQALESVIRLHLSQAIERCGGNKAQAAKLLRIPRTTLYKLLHRHGLA